MTIRNIIKMPNTFLRKKILPVEFINNEIKVILDDMLETMYEANGVGLAASQIGVDKRLIVMDCGKEPENKEAEFISNPIKMINPKIEKISNTFSEREEGCLSIPGHYGKVKRPKKIIVSFLDENENKKKLVADGLLSVCIQHELDHLNGILFIDHLSRIKKDFIIKKIFKENFKKRD